MDIQPAIRLLKTDMEERDEEQNGIQVVEWNEQFWTISVLYVD